MKIYEYIKTENERILKLFGFPIYKQSTDYRTTERLQSFLGGFITTFLVNDLYEYHNEKDIKILGQSIIRRVEDGNTRKYYCNNKLIKSISLKDVFENKYLKLIDKKFDDIYLLNANSGEAYLFLTYVLDAYLKKNNSKNPLLLATQPYHVEMANVICPDIPCIFINKLKHCINGNYFNVDKFRVFIVFPHEHFASVEIDIKNKPLGTTHYFKSILERFDIPYNAISERKINIPIDVEKSMVTKITKVGLRLNNFVFLAPEAHSCQLMNNDFWIKLINALKANGYDVFVNMVNNILDLKDAEYKTCKLTYSEAFALAKRAKKIISLRSGFTEFLLQTETPIDVLYTKFKIRHYSRDMAVEEVMAGFGIKDIPNTDHLPIQEFNSYNFTKEELIQELINNRERYEQK